MTKDTKATNIMRNVMPAFAVMALGLGGAYLVYENYFSDRIEGSAYSSIAPAAGSEMSGVEGMEAIGDDMKVMVNDMADAEAMADAETMADDAAMEAEAASDEAAHAADEASEAAADDGMTYSSASDAAETMEDAADSMEDAAEDMHDAAETMEDAAEEHPAHQ